MIDQEGGVVSRLHVGTSFVSALALGRYNDPEMSEEYGRQTGLLLRTLGFNTNLAPVLDISSPNEINFLGHRAFGGSVEDVSTSALSVAKGLLSAGVLPVAKHFPGHGGIIEDSHKLLPRKSLSLDQLIQFDLKPFEAFVDQFAVSGLMAAHLAFPNVDPSGLPASFSPFLSTEILRKKLNFKGILLTDDLEMASAKGLGSIEERTLRAIEAGADMVMFSWNQKYQRMAFEAVLAAVASGRLNEDRINESFERIQKVKDEIVRQELDVSLAPNAILRRIETLNKQIAYQHFQAVASEIADHLRSIRFSNVAVFSSDSKFLKSAQLNLGREKGLPGLNFRLGQGPKDEFVIRKSFKKGTIGIFYVTGQGSAELLRKLPSRIREHMIVVNTMYPGLIGPNIEYLGVINIYSRYSKTGEWTSDLIQKAHTQSLASASSPRPSEREHAPSFSETSALDRSQAPAQ